MFEPLRLMSAALNSTDWPRVDELQRLLENSNLRIVNSQGMSIRFVPQGARPALFEDRYEPRIYLKGEVQMRPRSWHDLLNALVWLTYPQSKAALNCRHFLAARESRQKKELNRGPVQDALTIFDEGGVIVASADPFLTQLLRGFQWKTLFWEHREEVASRMKFYLFGHAIYEKALQPFTGVTGKGVIFEVDRTFSGLSQEQQLEELDTRLSAYLSDSKSFSSTQELAPVPILGVPGWCPDNENEAYYENIHYFRPGRVRADNGAGVMRSE
jgi:hypothetical protein